MRRWTILAITFLLAAASTLMFLGIADTRGGWTPWKILFAQDEDGSWKAMSLDGVPVADRDFTISIAEGEIVSGRDDCNEWGYTDEPPGPDGSRPILSTLQACPEEGPLRNVYLAIARAGAADIALRPDGGLSVSAFGHQGLFRRCTWQDVRVATGNSLSQSRQCLPV